MAFFGAPVYALQEVAELRQNYTNDFVNHPEISLTQNFHRTITLQTICIPKIQF